MTMHINRFFLIRDENMAIRKRGGLGVLLRDMQYLIKVYSTIQKQKIGNNSCNIIHPLWTANWMLTQLNKLESLKTKQVAKGKNRNEVGPKMSLSFSIYPTKFYHFFHAILFKASLVIYSFVCRQRYGCQLNPQMFRNIAFCDFWLESTQSTWNFYTMV